MDPRAKLFGSVGKRIIIGQSHHDDGEDNEDDKDDEDDVNDDHDHCILIAVQHR